MKSNLSEEEGEHLLSPRPSSPTETSVVTVTTGKHRVLIYLPFWGNFWTQFVTLKGPPKGGGVQNDTNWAQRIATTM